MAACALNGFSLKLEHAAEALLLSAKDTDESKYVVSLSRHDRKGNWPVPDMKRVKKYCEKDVDVEVELFKRTGELPPRERELWLYDQQMNERGVRIDMQFVEAAQKLVGRAKGPLVAEFLRITELPALGSPKLKAWLSGHLVELPNLRAETIDEFLAGDTTKVKPVALRALHIRRTVNSASVKKLDAMKEMVCFDGRIRGGFQWHGTGPGRAAGRGVQFQNLPRGLTSEYDPELLVRLIKDGELDLIEATYGPVIECVSSALRHAIIPDKGKKFISGDFAQIQARIVLAIAGQYDKTEIMAAGRDIYCDMASKIFGRPITKKDKFERHIGKCAVLGLGFGMGWQKFKLMFAKDQTDEFCQEVVRIYREEWAPKVGKPYDGKGDSERRLWTRVMNAALAVTKPIPHWDTFLTYPGTDKVALRYLRAQAPHPSAGALICEVPSGHQLIYHYPKTEPEELDKKWWDDPETPKRVDRLLFSECVRGKWKQQRPFGGSLVENIVMRLEVDIKNAAIRNLEKAGYPVVLDIHDELVCEVADPDPAIFTKCMLDLPDWVKQYKIPVAIDTPWIAERYRK
jgi:DNA polymerase